MTKKTLSALFLAAVFLFSPLYALGQEGEAPYFLADQEFTDRDKRDAYDENDCIPIVLDGETASCQHKNVSISGGVITISGEGIYLLSGALEEGMVIIDADGSDKVQLILNNVSIHSQAQAPLYIKKADKVFITLAPQSQNILSNGGSFQARDGNNIDSVIFSKEDLTLNGSGSLILSSPGGHGIVSKDDLVVTGGDYQITAASHGLSGKDSLRILQGNFVLETGKDGLHAEHDEDPEKGYCFLADGNFVIQAQGDGVSASGKMQIDGGAYVITTGEGSQNAASASYSPFGKSGYSQNSSSGSMKALKAEAELQLNGGTFTIDAEDDAAHSNASLFVNGGSFSIATGDDGFHADSALVINGGSIQISQSYEGLEGQSVEIKDGVIHLTASDDGVNAAGGNDQSGFGGRWGGDIFAVDENSFITISGGSLFIDASGDGIDSNGHFTVSGGETYVSGPTNSGNGALDFGGNGMITGGTFLAAGSAGMAQSFDASSTQGVILASVNGSIALEPFALKNAQGETLISWQSEKNFNLLILSCPDIQLNETYTLCLGDASAQITMEQLVYTTGGGHGGRPGR